MSEAIQSELKYLKNVKAKEIQEKIKNARKFCDFNEDATYKDFIDEQYRLETKIKTLENKLVNDSNDTNKVNSLLNHKIKIKWLEDNLEETYCLVKPLYANIEKKYLSVESPLGKALDKGEENDEVLVNLPNGLEKIKILVINKM